LGDLVYPISVKGNKKVLIITYYWPPSGGSGVQRWLKFVKYLPEFGWSPFIFTPENPSFAIKDESLSKDIPEEAEVIHFPIWEPYAAFFALSGIFAKPVTAKPTQLVSAKNQSFFQRVSTWIRGNLFIPDPRVFWVKPSARFLEGFIKDNQISTIITTGPPHSLHLIGLRLKKKNPHIKWLADFRDPWSEWGFLDTLRVGEWARRYHKRLEANVLAAADEIITITPFYVRQFEAIGNRKVQLLTNGFDEDDFKTLDYAKSERFIIRHIGLVNEKCDPRPFLRAVQQLAMEMPEFGKYVQLEFIGEVHVQIKQFVREYKTLNEIVKFTGNIPHSQLIEQYGSSSLLVLILTGYKDAEGYMPGKLFEYLATGLPILGIGPIQGDAAHLLAETGAGEMIDAADDGRIKHYLMQQFNCWLTYERPQVKMVGVKYSRRAVTSQLSALISHDNP
jgi:glycosyltransferase involved in cell wall biosynthesis